MRSKYGANLKMQGQQGMTYAEVIICMLIAAMMIGPICISFVSSTRIRANAEVISEATLNAEALLGEIKEKITKDIIDGTAESYGTSTKKLSDFLGSLDTARYKTSDYIYEIAIWKVDDALESDGSMNLSKVKFNKALKLHSGEALDGRNIFANNMLGDDIAFKADVANIKTYLAYNRELEGATLKAIKNGTYIDLQGPTYKGNSDKFGKITLQKKLDDKTYIFKIDGATDTGMGIINIDLRGVPQNCSLEPTASGCTCTAYFYKFINKTANPQIIRVIRARTDKQTDNHFNDKFYVLANSESTGETSIERVKDMGNYYNYIIAVVVRDQNPSIGEKGKIVKKMVDVYSYDAKKQ